MVKKLNDQGQETFDGNPVEIYQGRFSGLFDVTEEIAAPMSIDDEVVFLVSARVDSPKFTYLKDGTLKRSNTFKVEFAESITRHEAMYLLDNMSAPAPLPSDTAPETQPKTDSLFEDE